MSDTKQLFEKINSGADPHSAITEVVTGRVDEQRVPPNDQFHESEDVQSRIHDLKNEAVDNIKRLTVFDPIDVEIRQGGGATTDSIEIEMQHESDSSIRRQVQVYGSRDGVEIAVKDPNKEVRMPSAKVVERATLKYPIEINSVATAVGSQVKRSFQ